MTKAILGIIGGSGIYDLPGLEDAREEAIASPWGEPSAPVRHGSIAGLPVVFLPRHDRGHRLSPSDINYRANIDVLKRAGVTDLISLSACGSFKEELPPGTFVLVDQFVDRTHKRENSFFGKGCVAHVSMAHPVSPRLRIHLAAAAEAEGIAIARGGTYLCMEGPQFSSYAESMTYKGLGYSVIGMTNMPEAKLAREAELCYATVAMVTDFDCWHPDHDAVTVKDIIKVLTANAEKAKRLVARHQAFGLLGIGRQHLDDVLHRDGVVVGMPAIEIRHHGDSRVAELGFAGEFRLRHVGHADHRITVLLVGEAFGERRKLRAFHAHICAAAHNRYSLRFGGSGEMDAQTGRHRMRHRHMGDAAFAEERAFAFVGAVDELIDQDEGAGRQFFLERAAGRQRHEIGNAGALEDVDIGPVVDVGGRQPVALVVTRQECHRKAGDLADAQRGGRLAPRARDRFLDDFFEARQIVDAGAADDAEHRSGHGCRHPRRPRLLSTLGERE